MSIESILKQNKQRKAKLASPYNPITGEGACGERVVYELEDFPLKRQYLPKRMLSIPLIKKLRKYGGVDSFIVRELGETPSEALRDKVVEQFIRIRYRQDYEFWCASLAYIKRKGGGADILFRLNAPQRKLVASLEEMRLQGKPIRLILLKARQWGGSTCIQIYMAWLQLVHQEGLNSLIVGHVKSASTEVKSMFERMLKAYPTSLLYELGEAYNPEEAKLVGVGTEQNIKRIPQRNCNIKIGSAEAPDSARGGDYNLVHCTEVGLWKKTEGKTPEDIIRSACSGVVYRPYTMIIYESTANGTGNFFHREYESSKRGESQFSPLFVSWYEIEQYSVAFTTEEEERAFANRLLSLREQTTTENNRSESGKYLWWLWEQGATLEAIHWYTLERSKYNDHGDMASEYPSDDIEAFVHSGDKIFDRYQVEALRKACRSAIWVGEVVGKDSKGKGAFTELRFIESQHGGLWVWSKPEFSETERIVHRYLVVVDIGGRSNKADYSVITVFDRLDMLDTGGKPEVVAQWYGHIDMDILAWRSAQIAKYYDDALLVIEKNTLDTRDKDRSVDGDQSQYILNQIKDVYDNLYARKQSSEEIAEQAPKKYGFHTNVSTKPLIISTLVEVLRDRLYVERDERCLDEYLCYERKPNGSVGAISGKHDDLLMTRAIGLHICFKEMELPRIVKRVQQTDVKTKRKHAGYATI